jgi:hypothetical protein
MVLALLPGCSTNPITGRDQILALPDVQAAHAEAGFALFAGARRIVDSPPCAQDCSNAAERARFAGRVETIGARLNDAARGLSPESISRINRFQFEVSDSLGAGTASSARGRVAIGYGLVPLTPTDTMLGFLMAREMAHVIARHAEEDSGATLLFSALGHLLLPGINVILRMVATTVGSQALKSSWATAQQREADEIAVALLERAGVPVFNLAVDLQGNAPRATAPGESWAAAYLESARRVAEIAVMKPMPGMAAPSPGHDQDPQHAQIGPKPCAPRPPSAPEQIDRALCALEHSPLASKSGP